MSKDRETHRLSVERSKLQARWPAKFQQHCGEIAAPLGLKVFERDGNAWATDGTTEWILHRAINPKKLWREAWDVLRADPAALNTAH